MNPENHDTVTTVCYVRAPLLLEPVDRQIETLQACESEGAIDDLLLRSWPTKVTLNESNQHPEVLETYDRFTSWADRQGVSVEPPFRRRTRTSQVTGKTTELLATPLLALEIYADDELIGVFPHSANDETYTTHDAIARLRTGELPTPIKGETVSPIEGEDSSSGECPDCGGSLIDGQGLFACGECGWVGTVTEAGKYTSHLVTEESDQSRTDLQEVTPQ